MLRFVYVAWAKSPGDFERCYIRAVDGFERGIALAAGVVSIGGPIAFVGRHWRLNQR